MTDDSILSLGSRMQRTSKNTIFSAYEHVNLTFTMRSSFTLGTSKLTRLVLEAYYPLNIQLKKSRKTSKAVEKPNNVVKKPQLVMLCLKISNNNRIGSVLNKKTSKVLQLERSLSKRNSGTCIVQKTFFRFHEGRESMRLPPFKRSNSYLWDHIANSLHCCLYSRCSFACSHLRRFLCKTFHWPPSIDCQSSTLHRLKDWTKKTLGNIAFTKLI